jgi:hypothetical protein
VKAIQRGQAIVLVLLLTVIGVIGAIMLISTGLLTSEKMQLQNAADATAYSVSVLEARDLNYGAYMNRAIVANEVAVGQMVSMYSWLDMLESEKTYLNALASGLNLIPPPVGQALSAGVKGYASYIGAIGKTGKKFVEPLSKAVIKGLGILNQGYGLSQQAMHVATLVFSASAISRVPEYNVTANQSDIGLSGFGYFSLAMHYGSYYGDLLKIPSSKIFQLVQHPSKSDPDMKYLAQMVNDSRDGFTRHRSCSSGGAMAKGLAELNNLLNKFKIPNTSILIFSIEDSSLYADIPVIGKVKIWSLPGPKIVSGPTLECNEIKKVPQGGWQFSLFNIKMEVDATISPSIPTPLGSISLGTYGLKYSANLNPKVKRKGGTQLVYGKNSEQFIWSAADTAGLDTGISASVEFCVAGCISEKFKLPLPDLPYGEGSAYAGVKAADFSKVSKNESVQRNVEYGNGADIVIPWEIMKLKPSVNLSGKGSYEFAKGGYQKTNGAPEISAKFIGLQAPFILIGLTREKATIFQSVAPSGNFELKEADTPLAAIGKAEVYYSAPSDLSAFITQRAAAANGFNPYWDARLVDTSYIDRLAALTFQSWQVPSFAVLDSFKKLVTSFKGLFL